MSAYNLALSIQIVSIVALTDGMDALCKRVDETLYAAKQSGKNRVVTM